MDILTYTDEHKAFRKRAREFFKTQVAPFADTWEKEGMIPREIWNRMGEAGFLCMSIPEEYGGPGGDFLHSLIPLRRLWCDKCYTQQEKPGSAPWPVVWPEPSLSLLG